MPKTLIIDNYKSKLSQAITLPWKCALVFAFTMRGQFWASNYPSDSFLDIIYSNIMLFAHTEGLVLDYCTFRRKI